MGGIVHTGYKKYFKYNMVNVENQYMKEHISHYSGTKKSDITRLTINNFRSKVIRSKMNCFPKHKSMSRAAQ